MVERDVSHKHSINIIQKVLSNGLDTSKTYCLQEFSIFIRSLIIAWQAHRLTFCASFKSYAARKRPSISFLSQLCGTRRMMWRVKSGKNSWNSIIGKPCSIWGLGQDVTGITTRLHGTSSISPSTPLVRANQQTLWSLYFVKVLSPTTSCSTCLLEKEFSSINLDLMASWVLQDRYQVMSASKPSMSQSTVQVEDWKVKSGAGD